MRTDNLTCVGRVSENFLISGQGSVEDDFSRNFSVCTKRFSSKGPPVFQGEQCFHQISELKGETAVVTDSSSSQRRGQLATSRHAQQPVSIPGIPPFQLASIERRPLP